MRLPVVPLGHLCSLDRFSVVCVAWPDQGPAQRPTANLRVSLQMEHGTVSVLDPVDDLLVTHGAYFEGEFDILRVDGDPAWLRIGWAFRWLQSAHDFYVCPSKRAGLRQTDAMLRVTQNLQAKKKKQPHNPWAKRERFGTRKKKRVRK